MRPIYDYAFCLAKLKNFTGESKYIVEEIQSFKKLMSLRFEVNSISSLKNFETKSIIYIRKLKEQTS